MGISKKDVIKHIMNTVCGADERAALEGIPESGVSVDLDKLLKDLSEGNKDDEASNALIMDAWYATEYLISTSTQLEKAKKFLVELSKLI